MLLEQVLHIMPNQDYSRPLCYFRPQIYVLLHYAICRKKEKYKEKAMQTLAKPSPQLSK